MSFGLASRLRRIMEILDEIVPESEVGQAIVQRASDLALEQVNWNESSKAISTLMKAVRTNPLWFRGYVLLATICQHTLARQEAITTLKTGAKICQVCLRYLAQQSCTLVMQGAISRELQSRITRQIMTVMQYEDILRHQLAFALVECGRYDEALLWWTKRRGEHHA